MSLFIDIDECTSDEYCMNGATCINQNGTYDCTCAADTRESIVNMVCILFRDAVFVTI